MARTVIDIDDEALEAAARWLGTKTKKDTVNAALRAVIDRERRLAALARMREMVASGEIDLDSIEEKKWSEPSTPDDPAA